MRLPTISLIALSLILVACDSENKQAEQENKIIAPSQNPALNRQSTANEAAGLRFDTNIQTLKPLSEQDSTAHDGRN